MAIIDIPTGVLPEQLVEVLPQTGQENIVYRRLVEDEDLREIQITDDFIWYDGEWHPFSFDARICGAYFERYQQSVSETVAEMEQIIEEQAQMITELEEAVFGVDTTFQMCVTSLTTTTLNLVNESGEVVVPDALQTRKWSFEDITYEATVPKGTYYLRNDEYAIGVSGEMLPLVVDGTKVVDLGTVKVIAVGGEK